MLNDVLKRVCVLGAGGKMGSGIALLMLQEMASREAEETEDVGSGSFRLVLVDANDAALQNLSRVIKDHLRKYAERHINRLRRCFYAKESLVSNAEIIDYFVDGAMRIVRLETNWMEAKTSSLILEAIVEDVETKVEVFSQLVKNASPDTVFLTNTSSIPIHILNEKAKLQNRILGFHFYNPPLVQKLVELIIPPKTHVRAVAIAKDLVERLGKMAVHANDVAGFIGNGHFIREAMFACEKAQELSRVHSLPEAIYMMDKVTHDFLLRPMGIFQLIDYVGIDVFYHICEIMSTYIPNELFQDPLIDKMIKMERLGGQRVDGSQKDGFFMYEDHIKVGVYSPIEERYLPLKEVSWVSKCDAELGNLPAGHHSWKKLCKDPHAMDKIQNYFIELSHQHTFGAELARTYLIKSKDIAAKLVYNHVALCLDDVDAVLKNGFFHLYGVKDIGLP